MFILEYACYQQLFTAEQAEAAPEVALDAFTHTV